MQADQVEVQTEWTPSKEKTRHWWEPRGMWFKTLEFADPQLEVLRLDLTQIPQLTPEDIPVLHELDTLIICIGLDNNSVLRPRSAEEPAIDLIPLILQLRRWPKPPSFAPRPCFPKEVLLRFTRRILIESPHFSEWASQLSRLRLDIKCSGDLQSFAEIHNLLTHCVKLCDLVMVVDRFALEFFSTPINGHTNLPSLLSLNLITGDTEVMDHLLSRIRVPFLSHLAVQFKRNRTYDWQPNLVQMFEPPAPDTRRNLKHLRIANVANLVVNQGLWMIVTDLEALTLDQTPIPDVLLDMAIVRLETLILLCNDRSNSKPFNEFVEKVLEHAKFRNPTRNLRLGFNQDFADLLRTEDLPPWRRLLESPDVTVFSCIEARDEDTQYNLFNTGEKSTSRVGDKEWKAFDIEAERWIRRKITRAC